MATRLYLRDTPSYEAPTAGKKSTALPNAASTDGNSGSPFENRSLLTTRGETIPDSTLSRTSIASTAHVDQYLGRFTSRKLAAQTIAANTWTAGLMAMETNLGANSFHQLSVYVWRPSTSAVVGYIWDSHTDLGVEWTAALDGQVVTMAGAAVTAQAGDVLVMELWRHTPGQATATAYLQQHNFNSYVDVTNSTTADPASYLETPQNLTFEAPYLPASITGVFVETPGFAGPLCVGGNLYVLLEATELSPRASIMKSTDAGLTWTEMDAANKPGQGGYDDYESCGMVLSGTRIKYARMRSGLGNPHLTYHEFETSTDTWAPDAGKACTAVATTDIFTCTAHGYRFGDSVRFSGLTGGTGLSTSNLYFVIAGNLTANTFQVSTGQAGSSVNMTSNLTAGTVTRQSTAIVGNATGDPPQEQLTLVERSNGDLVLFYGEWVSSSLSRVVYRKKPSGGEWGNAVEVHAGATGSTAVVGASDKIHVFIKEDTSGGVGGSVNQIVHRSLSSSDVLSAAEAVNDNAIIGLESMVGRAVYYDDGGVETVYCAWQRSTGFLAGAFVLNDGTPTAEEAISDQIVWANPPDTTPTAAVASLAVDPATKTIYCLYSNNPSNTPSAQVPPNEGDLYLATRTHGVGWGTDVELRDGTRIQLLMSAVYTHARGKVLGIFYDDANGAFYDEVLLVAGSVSALPSAAGAARALGVVPVATTTAHVAALTTAAAARALGQVPVATRSAHVAATTTAAPARALGMVPTATTTAHVSALALAASARALGAVPVAARTAHVSALPAAAPARVVGLVPVASTTAHVAALATAAAAHALGDVSLAYASQGTLATTASVRAVGFTPVADATAHVAGIAGAGAGRALGEVPVAAVTDAKVALVISGAALALGSTPVSDVTFGAFAFTTGGQARIIGRLAHAQAGWDAEAMAEAGTAHVVGGTVIAYTRPQRATLPTRRRPDAANEHCRPPARRVV